MFILHIIINSSNEVGAIHLLGVHSLVIEGKRFIHRVSYVWRLFMELGRGANGGSGWKCHKIAQVTFPSFRTITHEFCNLGLSLGV
jgi:hypothetical protein